MIIKKATIVVILLAIGLAAAVYYFDWKKSQKEKPAEDASKPAFSMQAADVVSMMITHPAQTSQPPVRFEKRNGSWEIVEPIQTDADQSAVEGIVDQVAGARIEQTEPGAEDRRKAYGLDPPKTSVELTLQNGAKHTLLLGDNDFTGSDVYAIVDGGQSVALLPVLLATSTGKSLDDLRDRAVLHMDSSQVASFTLKNSTGELELRRENDQWKFVKPADVLADKDSVEFLLSVVANAQTNNYASEKPENLAKYGLVPPAITFTAEDAKGKKSTLLVGKKDGALYFGRDASRPMIFRFPPSVEEKLAQGFADLRDKSLVHVAGDDIQRVEIHNANGEIVATRKKDNQDEWAIEAPADQKGKSAASWRILDPITRLKADEVVDHPAAIQLAALANPGIRVVLGDKDGRSWTVRVSKPEGESVYAQASDGAALYRLKKQAFDDLNFKPADLAY